MTESNEMPKGMIRPHEQPLSDGSECVTCGHYKAMHEYQGNGQCIRCESCAKYISPLDVPEFDAEISIAREEAVTDD